MTTPTIQIWDYWFTLFSLFVVYMCIVYVCLDACLNVHEHIYMYVYIYVEPEVDLGYLPSLLPIL